MKREEIGNLVYLKPAVHINLNHWLATSKEIFQSTILGYKSRTG
jgi:hypothetical protein